MKSLVVIAEEIAREAHAGQKYDVRDYVDAHVEPIALFIKKLGYSEAFQAAGWLHDVLEDSDITAEDLGSRGVSPDVIAAVELLTNQPGQVHEEYLRKIGENDIALVAKFADSSYNYANTVMRAPDIEETNLIKWVKKYSANITFLRPKLPMPR